MKWLIVGIVFGTIYSLAKLVADAGTRRRLIDKGLVVRVHGADCFDVFAHDSSFSSVVGTASLRALAATFVMNTVTTTVAKSPTIRRPHSPGLLSPEAASPATVPK